METNAHCLVVATLNGDRSQTWEHECENDQERIEWMEAQVKRFPLPNVVTFRFFAL